MARLSISLLGPPRLECGDQPIRVDTRKADALLAYLAVTRQQHRRDSLATLLWPENDQPHARSALRRTLFTLNHALEKDWLDFDREIICLNFQADISIDVYNFESSLAECQSHGHSVTEVCTACIQPLTKAVELYHGDFMAGFSLRDSPNFDDWQFYQADRLRRNFASALEKLIQCDCALRHFDKAIAHALRWLAVDRLNEPSYRQLMLLYTWAGQRASALHQYQECLQMLDRELGVAPLEETTQLYQLIKENHAPQLPPPLQEPSLLAGQVDKADRVISRISPAPTLQLPKATSGFRLVGRIEEWTAMLATYRSIDTNGRIIILEGEAGIGKTRLAEELLAHAHQEGATIIAARCYEGEAHLAYRPVVTALRAALASQNDTGHLEAVSTISPISLSEVKRLLPELVVQRPGLPPPPILDSPGAQGRFFDAILNLFLILSAGNSPGILFFDDLHWADGATLDLLRFIVRRTAEQPLCLMLAWRGKQLTRESPLYQLLVDAQRFGNALVLSLSRLNRPSIVELAQSVLVDRLPEHLTDRLYAETEGIPFFLIEYLTAIEKNVLDAGSAEWTLPGGVRDLLQSRLSSIDEIGWQLLTTAAVIGRSFDFDTLREASGRSEDATVTAMEKLTRDGFVEEVEEVQGQSGERLLLYDFSQEKLRALVYEETSHARRRLLHRRIAEVLVIHARGSRAVGPLAGHIARHYRLAGNNAEAANYHKLAGEYARSLYANAEALAHMQLALALLPPGHPDTAMLHETIGNLYTLLGEYSRAVDSYEAAAAIASSDVLSRIKHSLGTVSIRRGDWEVAENHLETALHTADERERARIYVDRSLVAYRRGQLRQALELAQQALTLAEMTRDMHALAQAHNILGILASHEDNLPLARFHLEQSLSLADKLNDPAIRAAALNNLAQAYDADGEHDRALALAETALALCVNQGDRHREAALHNKLADLLHAAGQTEAAMKHLKQAVSIYAEIGVEAGTVQPEIWKLSEW